MSELPNGWANALLKSLLPHDGIFSDGDWIESKDQDPNGSIRLLQLADIGDGYFVDKSSKFVNEEKFAALNCTELKTGDVLIARMPDPLGRACLLPEMPQPCITVVDVAVFRTGTKGASNKWLMNAINSPQLRAFMETNSSGTTRKRIARGKLADMELPVPPLPEQKRIADKLDAVLARVDACRDRLDRIPAILKRFRQSVLAAATSGRLTEDWRASTDIAVRDINSRLADERAHLWKGRGKYKPAVAANEIDSNEFADLPPSWLRGTLDQIAWSVKDGPHFSPKYLDTGIPFISGGSIKPGRIDLSIAKYISHDLHRELSLRCKPEYHDILYTKGGRTGLAAVNTLQDDFNVWVHVAVLKLVSKNLVNPFFVQYTLNSPDCYAQSQRYTRGVGNQDLGLTRMINIVLPVPPVEEQTEIVRRVETLFAYADRLEARHTAARAQVEKLTPATLAKAFRGELVPQDPSDEPASELLERIRAARESTPEKIRGRRKGATSQ